MKIVKNVAVFGFPDAGTTTLIDEFYKEPLFVFDSINEYKII